MKAQQIVTAALGITLLGTAIGEHATRRGVERRYQEALQRQRHLELQLGEMVAVQEQLQGDVAKERQRSLALSEALTSTRDQLEDAVGHLAQESQTTRELTQRLAGIQAQMDQLQGELSLAIEQHAQQQAAQDGPVELQRIVVGRVGTDGLQGRVVSVHSDWEFVVIDLGWNAVNIGDTISIFRDDQLLARAKIERVQEAASVATVLPEWKSAKIQVNDLVRTL